MLISAPALSGPNVSRPLVPSSKSERENLGRDLLWVGAGSKNRGGPSLEDGNRKVSASDVVKR